MTTHDAHTRPNRACSRSTAALRRLAVVVAAAAAVAGAAQAQTGERAFTLLLQQGFPKQTNTNKQIDQINATFGTDFDTWDDVANLNIGGTMFWRVLPTLQVGFEIDYSQGEISGAATVPTEAGDARLRFKQRYSIYADAMAVAHWLPCERCTTVRPFVLGGLGVGYEKDRTTLTLRNDYLDESLRVDNDGTFPVFTAGVGIDAYVFGNPTWYFQVGGAYYWGRLKHKVAASGSLAPSPTVEADNDTTGPNYWIGIGHTF